MIEVYDDEDAATMFATIKFLDASVEIEEEKYRRRTIEVDKTIGYNLYGKL